MSGRVHKSILNAEVNLLFYFLSLFLAFFSRKIFLDNLGAEFIGLTSTLSNILGYLNLAELGIGSCISFFLFKPLQENNRNTIQEIMSVYGYIYRCIGLLILGGGIIISLFFPLIFNDADISMSIVYFAFFSFLGSSLISYFINYRQTLLAADQKNYLVLAYSRSADLVRVTLQIILALTYKDLYLWVAVEFIFSIIGCLILNWKIDKEYPWLHTDKRAGRHLLKNYPAIKTKTRQIFIHKIKDFILRESDSLFIFAFVSLKMVAYYGNYILITSKIATVFSMTLSSISAGIGNLVAEGNKQNSLKVFWELTTIHHFIAGFICFSIYYLIEPFITLWLGCEYILDHNILILLLLYLYMSNSRGSVDMFNFSYGLYGDVWAAWVELVLNVAITIVAGYYYGIAGILMGKIISVFFIIVLWKPYYLFSAGLKHPVSHYLQGTIRYYLIFATAFICGSLAANLLPINPASSYLQWIVYAVIIVSVFTLIECSGLYLFAHGAKDLSSRLRKNKQ